MEYTASESPAKGSSPKRPRVELPAKDASGRILHVDSIPTVQAEQAALRQAELRILDVCGKCRFRRDIVATAIIFMKRFFLIVSPLEYLPMDMVGTCIFLAIKTDACPYNEVGPFHARLVRAMNVREDQPAK